MPRTDVVTIVSDVSTQRCPTVGAVRALVVIAAVAALLGSCASSAFVGRSTVSSGTVRIALVGDVMLGRGVGVVVDNDPDSVVEGLRPAIIGADLALANLESPLTERTHRLGLNALEAAPTAARLLSGAGFDAVAIANNHAGDAGPDTVLDTVAALEAAGLGVIGGGADADAAAGPYLAELHGVTVAVLAFDLTGGGPPAGPGPGIAPWDEEATPAAIDAARAVADVVIVGLHGGVEGLPRPDPVLRRVVGLATEWGADVVWGSGAHVAYSVSSAAGVDGRTSVQAPGLGNALFDQGAGPGGEGTLLEVLVDRDGVIATRTGRIASHLRSRFVGWDDPAGDAVALDGEWWALARPVDLVPSRVPVGPLPAHRPESVVVDAALGDVDGDGADDIVVSYRRPFEPKLLHRAFPDADLIDAAGRAAHLAVYRADGTVVWGAGTLLPPVADVEVCDGALALGFSGLDDPTVTSAGAWRWSVFGFSTAAVLEGAAQPGCADVDGDGRTDPVLTGRSRPAIEGSL